MTPSVKLIDGQLVVTWPDPAPAHFEIASDLFTALVDEINTHRGHRRNIAGLLRQLADRLDGAPATVPTGSPAVLSTVDPG
jgi:hypothetical protein